MNPEVTYLITPDDEPDWPTLHEHIFEELSERWLGSLPTYYAHC